MIYAHDRRDPAKHSLALQLLDELHDSRRGLFSVQVLNEFYAQITRATRHAPLSHDEALIIVRDLAAAWVVAPITAAPTLRALTAMSQHGLSFWDALIWAAAREAGADVVFTEDFQNGRIIEGITFVNPFLTA